MIDTAKNLNKYDAYIFDCDGVILDSNRIKTDAFRQLAMPFGAEVAQKFVEYHEREAGVSRHVKIRCLLTDLVDAYSDAKYETLLEQYGQLVRDLLVASDPTKGFIELMQALPANKPKFVASGGLESELHSIFSAKQLDKYFKGIHGSPTPKQKIVDNIVSNHQLIGSNCLFFGDARYDHEVASSHDMDFVFVRQYSDFRDGAEYFAGKDKVTVVTTLADLI